MPSNGKHSPLSGKLQRGTPTKYRPEYAEEYRRLRMVGFTDAQFAQLWGVPRERIWHWKKANPELAKAEMEAGVHADANVVKSLYQRAIGYDQEEEVVIKGLKGSITKTTILKHYPPEPVACFFWLKNRQPELWGRDKEKSEIRKKLEFLERALGIAQENTGRVPQILEDKGGSEQRRSNPD